MQHQNRLRLAGGGQAEGAHGLLPVQLKIGVPGDETVTRPAKLRCVLVTAGQQVEPEPAIRQPPVKRDKSIERVTIIHDAPARFARRAHRFGQLHRHLIGHGPTAAAVELRRDLAREAKLQPRHLAPVGGIAHRERHFVHDVVDAPIGPVQRLQERPGEKPVASLAVG